MGKREDSQVRRDSNGKSFVLTEEYILSLSDRVARLEENVSWIKKFITANLTVSVVSLISIIMALISLAMRFTH